MTFRHPLLRSVVYRGAAANERRAAHDALAEATDPVLEPDRRVWHRAQASAVPNEGIAAELEQMSERARARGGMAAAAAFLESAVRLTPDQDRRSMRAIAAAEQKVDAGELEDAERLLRTAIAGGVDELRDVRAERLRARIALTRAFDDSEALRRALEAARRLVNLDPKLGRDALLGTFVAARYVTNREVCIDVGRAFNEEPLSTDASGAAMLLRGYGRLLADGYPAGTDVIVEALGSIAGGAPSNELEAEVAFLGHTIAGALWDHARQAAILQPLLDWARNTGALALLPKLLVAWAGAQAEAGEFADAIATLQEAASIATVTGVGMNPDAWGFVHAWCDDETVALDAIAQIERDGALRMNTELARAQLFNGLGRYDLALATAQRSCDAHQLGAWGLALVELIEAAVRTGDAARAEAAFEALRERTRQGGTEWALGIEARAKALLVTHDPEALYREAIERLTHTAIRPQLARAHLLYGEWLRRENRRVEARAELLKAHELFTTMGAAAFTDRAGRELAATGEHVRKRSDDQRIELTAQETQIARLASSGLTNAQIAAQLFISPRTVEWHLRQVFAKLGVASRRELRRSFPPG